jgi:hypothetical protein
MYCLAHYFPAGLMVEQFDHPAPDKLMVIGHENANLPH